MGHDMRYRWLVLAAVLIAAILSGYFFFFTPPTDFPKQSVIRIDKGATATSVSRQFSEARLITYPFLFRTLLRISGGSARIQAGSYLFDTPENLVSITYRVVTGDYGLPPVRITFPEGETVRDAAERVHDTFPDILVSDFISKAQPYEGYLFPDTYLFLPSADAETIIATMRENFTTKTASLAIDSEIVILASLIEKEARTSAVKRMVSGILWNRLKLGMPLQVDAVFGYIYGRDTYSPTFDDLKVDSPYNTYLHKGLPPGPIANPGLDSLDAALHPTKTDYLYYLTGTDGNMYYATTYAAHQANQRKYLR